MKPRIIAILGIVALSSTALWASYDQEFVKAHEWMYTNGMTQYSSIEAYQPDNRVTREQAAKFFVAFDRTVLGHDAETLMYCVYSDEVSFDSTLAASIQSACNRGLMRWADGVFLPHSPLTKAQALTILIRALEDKQDETQTPRRKAYYTVAFNLWLTKESDVRTLDRPVTRYELALLLRRVENPVSAEEQEVEMSEIVELLTQLGLQTE